MVIYKVVLAVLSTALAFLAYFFLFAVVCGALNFLVYLSFFAVFAVFGGLDRQGLRVGQWL